MTAAPSARARAPSAIRRPRKARARASSLDRERALRRWRAEDCRVGLTPRARDRGSTGTRRSPTPPQPRRSPASPPARRPEAIGRSLRGDFGTLQRLGFGAVQEFDGGLQLRVLVAIG